ncbi:MAG: hypothetical protein ACYDDQ_01945 [Vulcanimicrobiaceae bacterium]
MGKNRWRKIAGRNKTPGRPNPKPVGAAAPATVTLTINSVTPSCPGMERPGLDGVVYIGLQEVDALVRDMRKDIGIPNGVWDEESAVRRYLVYLSMLVDITLADIAMSAVHSNDMAVLMKERMLVEYAIKAIYFNDHPDYALYMTTIHEALSIRDKTRDGGGSVEELQAAEAELAAKRAQFPKVAHLKKLTLSKIMREHTRGGDPQRNDEYVWLYGAPSAIMHGDPEGMRALFPIDDEERQQPKIELSDAYLNALMVDSGSYSLNFCGTFVERFHPGDEIFARRLQDLGRQFKALALKHPEGRDESALAAIRTELEDDVAAGGDAPA